MKIISLNNENSGDSVGEVERKKIVSEIYHKYYTNLYSYGLKISKDEDVTKDCIQEVFISLWKSSSSIAEIKSIKPYLFISLKRSIIYYLQKEKKNYLNISLFSKLEPDIVFSSEEIIIDHEQVHERKKQLSNLINSLPKRQREIIYLKYYEELSYEEISDVLSINYQSVINHIHKAFKTLRNIGYCL